MNILLLNVFTDSIKGIFSIIPKFAYFIVACCISLIDLFQVSFRKIAGLEPIMIGEETFQGDIVYKLITEALFGTAYPAIKTVFWSLIILGVFMLFITSIIALIRLEYNPDKEKGNSKSGVVKNFFKAIFSFAIIPVACLFGMFLCNSLIGVIDNATASSTIDTNSLSTYFDPYKSVEGDNSMLDNSSALYDNTTSYMAYEVFGLHIPTTTQPFSGMVFKACAYNANRIRNNSEYFEKLVADNNGNGTIGFINNSVSNNSKEVANVIDTGFAINAKLKGVYDLNKDIAKEFYNDYSDWITPFNWKYTGISNLSKYNVNAVYYFYDLWTFNYIIAFVAITSIAKSYYNFVLYLMQRFFEILGLFVISPISISLMPLDNGKALSKWREFFITKFALLVIMVTTLNLVTPLISICQNIKLFNLPVIDYIILTLFIIASLNAVNTLNSMLAKIFAEKGDFGDVDKASDSITGSFKSGLNKTTSVAKLGIKPIKWAAHGGIAATMGAGRKIAEKRRESKGKKLVNDINSTRKQYNIDKENRTNEQASVDSKIQLQEEMNNAYNSYADYTEKAFGYRGVYSTDGLPDDRVAELESTNRSRFDKWYDKQEEFKGKSAEHREQMYNTFKDSDRELKLAELRTKKENLISEQERSTAEYTNRQKQLKEAYNKNKKARRKAEEKKQARENAKKENGSYISREIASISKESSNILGSIPGGDIIPKKNSGKK